MACVCCEAMKEEAVVKACNVPDTVGAQEQRCYESVGKPLVTLQFVKETYFICLVLCNYS
jgi:hypothetical protein